MADHDPMQPVGGSPLPPAAPRLATREELCGPGEPRTPLTDEEAALVAAPVAPLSPQDIAEMLRKLRLARKEVHTLPNSAARLYGDAADAIEALTAENARLTSERDELRIGLWEIAHGDPPANPQDAELAQSLLGEWSGDEYEDVTSRTLRNLSNPEFMSAAFGEKSGAKDDGIDMALLGRLCREEPDADTKREVGDMMRGLYAAMEDSPLSHPRYPDLVKMARESSKDGD